MLARRSPRWDSVRSASIELSFEIFRSSSPTLDKNDVFDKEANGNVDSKVH